MKILALAFAGIEQSGVHRKLAEQAVAMRAAGATVHSLVVCDIANASGASLDNEAPFTLVPVVGGGFGAGRASALSAFSDAVARHQPDVVYMRYPVFDAAVQQWVQQAPATVFELQTIYANEVHASAAAAEHQWAAPVLEVASGLVAVTNEILAYETNRAAWDIPGHVMPNGAGADTVPFTQPMLDATQVNVLCVANLQPWHGIDRLIVGLAAEPDVDNVHLHLVGDGAMLPALRALAGDAGMLDRVHFHGAQPMSNLGAFYERAHVALGSLAPHRVGLRELAALKHREYALRGIPMVLAGGDADFSPSLPWLRQIPADDTPVSPRMLRALAHAWSSAARRRQIRAWAEVNVTWAVKMPKLLEFLDTCRASAPTRRLAVAS